MDRKSDMHNVHKLVCLFSQLWKTPQKDVMHIINGSSYKHQLLREWNSHKKKGKEWNSVYRHAPQWKLLGYLFKLVGRALAFELEGPVFKPSCRQSSNMLH